MQSELFADVTLYPVGGRQGPIIGERYSCPCMLHEHDCEGRDARLFLDGEPLRLGQTRRVGFAFLSFDSAEIFRSAGKFYLWEGRIIGEAFVRP